MFFNKSWESEKRMIKSVSFENFRGLKKLELDNLSQVTLISGRNNAGKSTILEGIFLLFDHVAPESFVKINNFRGLPFSSNQNALWEPIFYNMNAEFPVSISIDLDEVPLHLEYTKDNNYVPTDFSGVSAPQEVYNQFIFSAKSSYSLKFRFTAADYEENGHFIVSEAGMLRNIDTNEANNQVKRLPFVQYINSAIVKNDNVITEWFGKLELHGKKEMIINALKVLDESISDISTIAINGQIQLYAKMGGQLLPLKLAGDGLNKLLFMVLAIVENPNSIILIDEIESGFHYSMYDKLWNVVASVARENNCQIIATTHSYECIDGSVEGIKSANMQDKFCFYRIEKNGENNKSFRYSGDLLRSAVESNMEVR